jgi:acetylornithine deacetylase
MAAFWRAENMDGARMDAITILRTLIGFDTTSRNSNLALTDWVADYLDGLGARLRLSFNDDRSKANVLASFGPDRDGGVVLSGHTDVVPVDGQPWSFDPFTLTERDGRLHGRGTADMKGFVACCLAAAPAFAAAPLQRPIHLALSYDEEIGCFGVPQLIADLLGHGARPAFAIIGEPTGMAVGDRHRGFFGHRTTFHGSAAHSSNPAAGVSAIYPAAALVGLLRTMAHTAGEGTSNVTFNVGCIHGGSAINIVPSACEVHWEFRPAETTDVAGLTAAIDTFLSHAIPPGVRVDHETTIRIPQLNSSDNQSAVGLAHELGGALPTIAMPFGTEAGYFQDSGIPAVVCGPGSIAQAHQPDEWIAVDQLDAAGRFLDRLASWASAQ